MKKKKEEAKKKFSFSFLIFFFFSQIHFCEEKMERKEKNFFFHFLSERKGKFDKKAEIDVQHIEIKCNK